MKIQTTNLDKGVAEKVAKPIMKQIGYLELWGNVSC